MNALVTGGAGFIGSHLAEVCLARGDRVVVLDDLSAGRLANLASVLDDDRLTFVRGRVQDAALVDELVRSCDVVYHLAAVLGMHRVVDHPLAALDTNVTGTQVVLERAALHGKRTLFASTSEVYGLNEHKPSAESDACVLGSLRKRRWNYALAKGLGESYALGYAVERGLPVVIARLFNTVGPRQTGRYGMVLPTFVRQALAGSPITVFGDGSQSRCFADVAEVAPALAALMDEPRALGDVFNVGTNEEVTILDLARRVKAATGSASPIAFTPHDVAYEPGFEEIARRIPDISKIRSLIGFDPRTRLDDMIAAVVRGLRAEPVPI